MTEGLVRRHLERQCLEEVMQRTATERACEHSCQLLINSNGKVDKARGDALLFVVWKNGSERGSENNLWLHRQLSSARPQP